MPGYAGVPACYIFLFNEPLMDFNGDENYSYSRRGRLRTRTWVLESAHLRRQTYKKDAYVPQKMSLLQS